MINVWNVNRYRWRHHFVNWFCPLLYTLYIHFWQIQNGYGKTLAVTNETDASTCVWEGSRWLCGGPIYHGHNIWTLTTAACRQYCWSNRNVATSSGNSFFQLSYSEFGCFPISKNWNKSPGLSWVNLLPRGAGTAGWLSQQVHRQ